MKTLLTVLFLSSWATCLAQSGPRPALELTYTYVNTGMGEKRDVTLVFSGQESLTLFSMKDSVNTGASPRDFTVNGEDARGRQVYKNTATGVVMFRDFVPTKDGFEPCIIHDPMKAMKWSYSTEMKQVGKYSCKAAATEFRGRKYVAWYTEDIPVSHGPWKFSGLPGAIVEIYSTDKAIVFTLSRIEQRTNAEIHPLTGEKEITIAEYVRRKEQGLADFLSNLAAKLPRGAQLTATTTGDYNLETDFSDVKK